MIFLKRSKQEILQCIGEVLEKSYGKDYDSVLPMFADTDCPMPEIYIEPSEERNKQLEDRFLYCIQQSYSPLLLIYYFLCYQVVVIQL